MLANAKSLILTRSERRFFCCCGGDEGDPDCGVGEDISAPKVIPASWLCESCVDLRVEGLRERTCEGGRLERERADVVEAAPDARREMAGDGGAGREEVSGDEVESRRMYERESRWVDIRIEFRCWFGVDGVVSAFEVGSGVGVGLARMRESRVGLGESVGVVGLGVGMPVGVVAGDTGDRSAAGSGREAEVGVRALFISPDGLRGTTKEDLLAGVGVTGDTVFESPKSALSAVNPLSFSRGFSSAAVVAAAGTGSALPTFFPLPRGGGRTANSCAPGMGGGRNEEEGDGKGDELGGWSTWRARRGCC